MRRPLHRRRLLAGFGAGIAALAGVRCSDDEAAPAEVAVIPTAEPTVPYAGPPLAGGNLRVLFRETAATIDPHRGLPSLPLYAWQWVGNFLLRQSPQAPYGPEPDLAVALPEMPGDGSLLIFKLNPAARFHDKAPANGRAVTSADVKATFDRLRTLGTKSSRSPVHGVVDSITTPDATTVQFKLRGPRPDFLSIVADQADIVVPAEIAAKGETAITSLADVVGSGPFIAEQFSTDRVRLARAPGEYWRGARPWLESCDILFQPDDSGRANALLQRTVDLTTLPAETAALFAERQGFAVTAAANSARHVLFVNHTTGRFKDARLRLALSRALDRTAFYGPYREGVPGGPLAGSAATWALPDTTLKTLPGYLDRDTDLNEAARLMTAAGSTPDGFVVPLLTSAAEGLPALARRARSSLAEAGINLEITEVPGPYSDFQAQLAAGNFTFALGIAVAGPYPDAQLYAYHHSRSGGANYGHLVNPALDAKLERQRVMMDAPARLALLHEIQRDLITAPGPVWIGSPLTYRVAGNRVEGARTLPFLAGYDDAERAWLRPGS